MEKRYKPRLTQEESEQLRSDILKNLFKVDKAKLISDLSKKYNIHPTKVIPYIKGVSYSIEEDNKDKASDKKFWEKRKNYDRTV
ncbi:MAG: hypothetical protein M1594_00290 [Candidatus Marsarchaeota archaeon]|nr:hypothetical protein [Candidatus Marsarchaeota archaeon]